MATAMASPRYIKEESVVPNGAIAIMVRMRSFGNRRKIGDSEYQVDASKEMTSATKKLLACKELSAIQQIEQRVGNLMRSYYVPSCFKTGVYLVPPDAVEELIARLDALHSEWSNAVGEFLDAYDQRKLEAKDKLQGLWREGDYPSRSELRLRFSFDWYFMSFDVPGELALIDKSAYEEARRRAKEGWDKALEQARDLIRGQLRELVDDMADRIKGYADGKQKTIRETGFDKVREFIAAFETRNSITNDDELRAIVVKLDNVLRGVDVESIRESESMRSYAERKFTEVKQELTSLMSDKPSRLIAWDYDD